LTAAPFGDILTPDSRRPNGNDPVNAQTLTIGQLAAYVGVTTRAIRHYHAQGLLAEPARGASGYRRYDAKAVVDLVRVKTLADAGVPLARIRELLSATPEEFSSSLTMIDRTLENRIRDLDEHRAQLADLAHGERLFLAGDIVDMLDEMRYMGVSEQTVQIERDGWILASVLSPELVPEWVEQKKKALEDLDFRQLYLACDEAFDWDPEDPRLPELAARIADWSANNPHSESSTEPDDDLAVVVQLMTADIAAASPAWERLGNMVPKRLDP
jgi:DNA-binding transcriptional MerR regulator